MRIHTGEKHISSTCLIFFSNKNCCKPQKDSHWGETKLVHLMVQILQSKGSSCGSHANTIERSHINVICVRRGLERHNFLQVTIGFLPKEHFTIHIRDNLCYFSSGHIYCICICQQLLANAKLKFCSLFLDNFSEHIEL